MIRPLVVIALFSAPLLAFGASQRPRPGNAAVAPVAPGASDPGLAAAAAAAAAQGWIDLLRDYSLADWQRLPLPADAPLDARNPWRLDPATGILHCDATGLHEMLLHRTERGDGIFHVEWRFSGTPGRPAAGAFVRTKPDHSAAHQADLAPNSVGMLSGVTPGKDGKAGRFNSGRRRPDLLKKGDEWNVMEFVCMGSRVMLHFNGVVTAEYRECTVPAGLVGVEADGSPIEFRHLRFKPLK